MRSIKVQSLALVLFFTLAITQSESVPTSLGASNGFFTGKPELTRTSRFTKRFDYEGDEEGCGACDQDSYYDEEDWKEKPCDRDQDNDKEPKVRYGKPEGPISDVEDKVVKPAEKLKESPCDCDETSSVSENYQPPQPPVYEKPPVEPPCDNPEYAVDGAEQPVDYEDEYGEIIEEPCEEDEPDYYWSSDCEEDYDPCDPCDNNAGYTVNADGTLTDPNGQIIAQSQGNGNFTSNENEGSGANAPASDPKLTGGESEGSKVELQPANSATTPFSISSFGTYLVIVLVAVGHILLL